MVDFPHSIDDIAVRSEVINKRNVLNLTTYDEISKPKGHDRGVNNSTLLTKNESVQPKNCINEVTMPFKTANKGVIPEFAVMIHLRDIPKYQMAKDKICSKNPNLTGSEIAVNSNQSFVRQSTRLMNALNECQVIEEKLQITKLKTRMQTKKSFNHVQRLSTTSKDCQISEKEFCRDIKPSKCVRTKRPIKRNIIPKIHVRNTKKYCIFCQFLTYSKHMQKHIYLKHDCTL